MSRVEHVQNLDSWSSESSALFSAFVACLTPQEACQALDLTFNQPFPKRRAILRKINKDIEAQIDECHYALINDLIAALQKLSHNKRQSCAHCLSSLYNSLPPSIQEQLLRLFLTSKYVDIRRRGYKILQASWLPDYESIIQENWNSYQEPECARLLIDNANIEYLVNHLDELREVVVGSFSLARLYIKVGADNPALLEQLAVVDEIAFAYALVKLQRPLTLERAFEIYERNKYDHRLSLLIWCFGQMGLWNVLEVVQTELDEILATRYLYNKPTVTS